MSKSIRTAIALLLFLLVSGSCAPRPEILVIPDSESQQYDASRFSTSSIAILPLKEVDIKRFIRQFNDNWKSKQEFFDSENQQILHVIPNSRLLANGQGKESLKPNELLLDLKKLTLTVSTDMGFRSSYGGGFGGGGFTSTPTSVESGQAVLAIRISDANDTTLFQGVILGLAGGFSLDSTLTNLEKNLGEFIQDKINALSIQRNTPPSPASKK